MGRRKKIAIKRLLLKIGVASILRESIDYEMCASGVFVVLNSLNVQR